MKIANLKPDDLSPDNIQERALRPAIYNFHFAIFNFQF